MEINVILFVKSHSGNQYAIMFTDYLTKWPKVFAIKDQTALTIAKYLWKQLCVVMGFHLSCCQIVGCISPLSDNTNL